MALVISVGDVANHETARWRSADARHIAAERIVAKGGMVEATGLFLAPIGGKERGRGVNGAGLYVLLRSFFDRFSNCMAYTCYLG